jgi:hypothetical protein
MDCNLARQLQAFARHRAFDLDAADTAAVEHHLSTCLECGQMARTEGAFDAAVANALRDVTMPVGLRSRLAVRLLASRRAWWRLTLLRLLTAMVAVLLATSIGHYVGRPTINVQAVIQNAYEMTGPGHTNDEVRDAVTAWLRLSHTGLSAPAEFNYKLLVATQRGEFQGRQSVPTLVFVRGEAIMYVYVVPEGAYKNLRTLAGQPVEEGGCKVAVRSDPELPGWSFVIVTSGASPDHFQRAETTGNPL